MRIFCPATLSVLFLPRFVARLVRLELPRLHSPCLDDDTTNTEAIGTKSESSEDRVSGKPSIGSDQDLLPLFVCHCSPVHAVGRVAFSLILRRTIFRSSGA